MYAMCCVRGPKESTGRIFVQGSMPARATGLAWRCAAGCGDHHGDLMRWGFQAVQGSVASSAERGAASRTSERLDPLRLTMLAIANERMHVSVGDPAVRALLIGTGVAFGVYLFGCSPAAFDLAPGTHRPRRRLSTRRGSGGETTGGAIVWAAGLEQTLHRGALGPSS